MRWFLAFIIVAVAGGGLYWVAYRDDAAPAAGGWSGANKAVPVRVVVVAEEKLSETVEALGTAIANESVTLTANVTETVRAVQFEDGDYVAAGDVLVELTRGEEDSQLREAEVALDDARRKLARVEDLGRRSLVSTSEVDDARAVLDGAAARLATVRARLGDRLITAPFDGVLGFRNVSVGTLVSPGTTITTLDDISRIKVDFTVPEVVLGAIGTGDTLEARSVAFRDERFAGRVVTIGSRIDPVTRSAQVRAVLPNDDRRLRPGMLLTVDVVVNERLGIRVPARAILQETVRAFVYIVRDDNTAERREVTLGQRSDDHVEILGGLAVGERVIVSGVVKLRDGSAVAVQAGVTKAATPARRADVWLAELSVRRPVLATVFAVLLIVAGIISLRELSVREYPDVSSPIVSVRVTYPGAASAIVDTQVTEIVEGAVSGVEGIRSISSVSQNGSSRVNIEFTLSRNIDEAANDVRDRVSRILDELPEDVEPPRVQKQDSDARPVVWINLSDPSRTSMEVIDYAERYIAERFSALPGVSAVEVNGPGRPSMRIWIDRIALAARGLTVGDVDAALRRENVEFPAGLLEASDREFPVRLARGYETPEDFRQLVLAEGDNDHLIRLGEVARVEVGPRNPRRVFRANGQAAAAIGIFKQSTANTVDVLDGVNRTLAALNAEPGPMTLTKSSDDSVFIRAAINTVYQTMLLTILLVAGVIFLFLMQWRATVVPVVTIPISLIATFAAINLAGFSINLITLLALVLCIGLVVDDAIVVLENIFRRIQKGEPALLASKRGASQVVFAVIATTAVLVAVFAPITFLTDNVGRIFAELAITLCAALILSSVLALSVVPMLASKLLRGHGDELRESNAVVRFIEALSVRYSRWLEASLRARYVWVAVAMVTAVGSFALFNAVDREYVPDEDRGSIFGSFRGPEGASIDFMMESLTRLEEPLRAMREEGSLERGLLSIPGWRGGISANNGFVVVTLAPWGERDVTTAEVVARLNQTWSGIEDLRVFTFSRSPFGGGSRPVEFVLGGSSYIELADWRDRIIERARANPGLNRLDSDLIETQPQMIIDVDADRAAALGVPVQSIGRELQLLMADQVSTRFQRDGEEYDVVIQAEEEQRRSVSDLQHVYVRSDASGELIPLSNLVSVRERAEPASLNRYNRLRAVTITADLAPGYALGEALDFLRQVANEELPPTAQIGYKGDSREYIDAGNALLFTFVLALTIVYLVLAAQFESFVQPLVIMCTVPLALAGGFLGLALTDTTLNIYSQIGLLMLIGIATKNGILIVEFINQIRDAGVELFDGIVRASTMRFRPVVMTTASTVMGSVPLILSRGPGSEGLHSLGVVIFWGVLVATVLTLFVVPVLYSFIGTLTGSPGAIGRELERLEEATSR